jgi:hypothetical protein
VSDGLVWFKSSYSDDQGGNCLEVAQEWSKPSHSDSQGGACLEVTPCPHAIHLRDSKLGPRSPRFVVAGAAWTAFVAYARTGT